jgi:hypothetical protein
LAKRMLLLCCVSAILIDIPAVRAEPSLLNLSGTYRCVPDTRPCQSPTFTVSQADGKLEVKSEQGEVGTGEMTSNIFNEFSGHRGTRSARFFLIG